MTCLAIIASCTIITSQLTATHAYSVEDFGVHTTPCLRQKGCETVVSTAVIKGQHIKTPIIQAEHPAAENEIKMPAVVPTESLRSSELSRQTDVSQTIQSIPQVKVTPQPSPQTEHDRPTASVGENCAPLLHTSFPVAKVPNWGAMRTPEEWNRAYSDMKQDDFVPVPHYDLSILTKPMSLLVPPDDLDKVAAVTAKLFYSTRYFGSYNIDAGEWTGIHAAIDLKLAPGTPIGAIGGGTVAFAGTDADLGHYVMIHHCTSQGNFYSIYGHFDSVFVHKDQIVIPGQTIGTVGMTGETTAPHLHLAVDREIPGEIVHHAYSPHSMPAKAEGLKFSMNPLEFISQFRGGDQQ